MNRQKLFASLLAVAVSLVFLASPHPAAAQSTSASEIVLVLHLRIFRTIRNTTGLARALRIHSQRFWISRV